MPDDGQGWNGRAVVIALQNVADRLDESPSHQQYEEERRDHEPSAAAAARVFGSWNDAKEAAGLKTYSHRFSRYRHVGRLGRSVEGERDA